MVVQQLARMAVAGPPQANGEQASRGWVQSFMGAVNVLDAGATGDGATDDTTAIQAAVDYISSQGGGIVIFSRGTYRTKAPIEQPENVELVGNAPGRITYTGAPAAYTSVIRPLSTHTGPAVVRMRGKDDTGRTYVHVNARVRHLMIDGSAGPASLKGVALYGLVREAVIEDVTVYKVTDAGFWCGQGTTAGVMPQSLRFFRCVAHTCGGAGFSFANVPDSVLDDCLSIGNAWVGFYLAGLIHSILNNCKAEWNTQHGVYITSGYWGTGTGAGGLAVTNLETDRNGYNGVYIDATGSAGLHFTSPLLRRDGRNGGAGGGGYAGLFVATTATMTVTIDNIGVSPGVDDDGTQTASPQVGISATGSTPVRIMSGIVHAITAALSVGTGLAVSPAVELRIGPTSSYTSSGGKALVGTDDSRLSDPRPPTAHTHAPAVVDLGTVSGGTFTPNATSAHQKGVISAAATLATPAAGSDGFLVTLALRATTATQTLTRASGYGIMAGQPDSVQIPVGKRCIVLMRYDGDLTRWVIMSMTVEA